MSVGVSPIARLDDAIRAQDAANRGEELVPCGLCSSDGVRRGDGDVCNPGNADPARALADWLPPIGCPRCGGTGWDPNPG